LVLAQAGLTAVGLPSSGHALSEGELERISTAKRRFLAGDNDPAGNKSMEGLQKTLRGATYRIFWPNNRKDANDVLTNECENDPSKFKILVEELKERATQTESIALMRRADQITPKQIRWMWPDKIPFGKITLFAGNPDNGKSLASTSVAAICSTGRPFGQDHFGHPPAEVLMLIGEDDPDDTAVPRLMAAGADLSKIHFLETVRPVKLENREVRLDVDIPAIERKLEEHPEIRLMVIDPISNYLGEVSMIAEQEVRSILIPLKRMAEKHNIAVVIVMHLNKKSDLDAISRVGGAMAFIGVARCSWLFTRNIQEETEEGEDVKPAEKKPDTFSMLRIKNNLVSANRAGMAYSVAVRPIEIEGEKIFTPYVIWGTVIEGSADDALNRRQAAAPTDTRGPGRPNNKLQAAIAWLEEALQDNLPHLSRELRKDAKDAHSISPDTLEKAYAALPGHKKPFKGSTGWFWQLEPLNETAESEGETASASELFRIEGAE
jgi:putative DNA primase/helicase